MGSQDQPSSIGVGVPDPESFAKPKDVPQLDDPKSADRGAASADADTPPVEPVGHKSRDISNSPQTKNVFGSQIQYGDSHNHYNVIQKDTVASVSFEDDLQSITECLDPEVEIPQEETERYVEVLRERRVVVVVHSSQKYREAISAMRSMRLSVRKHDASRQHYTSAFDGLFPMHSFYATKSDAWPKTMRNSLIFLDRSRDATASAYLGISEKLSFLRERLTEVDAQLIVTVSADGAAGASHSASQSRWFMDKPGTAAPQIAVVPVVKGHFESTVILCAAFFPALGVAEFVELVELLAPPRPHSQPSVQRDGAPKTAEGSVPAEPPEPTREQRWREGEHDAVLAELGISFRTTGEVDPCDSSSSQIGFAFTDEERRAAMPDFMLSNYATLLQRTIDTLTKRYLSSAASPRYRVGYRNLLFRLDARGIMPLTADWLINTFGTVDQGLSLLEFSRHCALLLVKAMDRKLGDVLVRTVLSKMVEGALGHERQMLQEISDEVLETTKSEAAKAVDAEMDISEAFWYILRDLPVIRDTAKLMVALQVMVTMSRHVPSDVATALNRLMSDEAVAETSWIKIIGAANKVSGIARLPRFALRWVLNEVINQEPSEWAAFAQVIVDEGATIGGAKTLQSKPAVSAYSRKRDDCRDSLVVRRLATDCLRALDSAVTAMSGKPVPDSLYEALFSEDRRDRTGRLFSRLIMEAKATEPTFVVWLLRELASSLLKRKGATPKEVSEAIFSLAAPLRAALTPAQRLAISATAHDVQNSFFARRNYFSALRNRAQAEVERERVAIMHMVIRAISGASTATAL